MACLSTQVCLHSQSSSTSQCESELPALNIPGYNRLTTRSMLLPFPVLLKTQIRTRKKVIILGLFALGVFVTAIQIIRFQTIKNLKDYLDSALPIQWSIVECNLGIIVACIPTLAPLVKYFAERSRAGHSSAPNPRRPPENSSQSSRALRRVGRQTHVTGQQGRDSTELILELHEIVKKTEVVVSSSDRNSGRIGSSYGDFGDEMSCDRV